MTNRVSFEDLRSRTKEFFDLHWSAEKCPVPPPTWDGRWQFRGPVGKTADMQGCYALLVEGNVVYIGVGASRNKKYPRAGLMARLRAYFKPADPADSSREITYEPKGRAKEWGVNEIRLIGMPDSYGYLACGLEAFLIFKLEPQHNKIRQGS